MEVRVDELGIADSDSEGHSIGVLGVVDEDGMCSVEEGNVVGWR